MHEFAVARLLFSSSLWKNKFSKAGTEKRTTLFHNVSFVTALKSSELGESANKEGLRGVHCAAPPWPRPSKNFHSMQSGARLCDTFEMKEMPDLICEEICIFWSTNIMDLGNMCTQNEMIWYISQVLAFWYSLDLFGTVWIWSWYYGEIQLGANYLQMHGIFKRLLGFIMCVCWRASDASMLKKDFLFTLALRERQKLWCHQIPTSPQMECQISQSWDLHPKTSGYIVGQNIMKVPALYFFTRTTTRCHNSHSGVRLLTT